jgi:phosphoglycolate phosphatase-like HAD superfamily hydrolase
MGAREDTSAVLLLFDIDGTLLSGAATEHALAMRLALHEVYGVGDPQGAAAGLPRVEAAGRTDLEIARETLMLCGRSATTIDDGLERLMQCCVREYVLRAPEDISERVLPGIPQLLAQLDGLEQVHLSLVTGNVEPIARSKLKRAGIGGYFPSDQGGFGSDSEDRSDLPGIARTRAGKDGLAYPRERTVVVGDTPRDIACARADGVRCLAVCSGSYGPDELSDADAVAEDTAQLGRLLAAELERA